MVDRVGQRLADYQLTQFLGEGKSGKVYLGKHIYREQEAAIKVLESLGHDVIPMFLNKARAIRLVHPNIVQVLDFGLEGGTPFLAMEYAPCGTLRQRHPHGTQLLLVSIVSYVKQIADALQYAHDEGLIHGEVKPEKMLLGTRGEILMSDFGITTISGRSRLFNRHHIAGTIAYTAPEQIQGNLCAASDQYALGITVYEWISGHLPFEGSFKEVATQHTLKVPPALLTMVSTEIEQVVFKALEKDPCRRYTSIQEFADALERVITEPIRTAILVTKARPSLGVFPVIAWSPTTHYLAITASNKHSIQVWNVPSREITSILTGHTFDITSMKWSSDGTLVAASSYNGTIFVWEAATGEPIVKYLGHTNERTSVHFIAWSPDAKFIVSEGDSKSTHVWNALTGEQVFSFIPSNSYSGIDELEWSPNGLYFATIEDMAEKVHVRDAADGSDLKQYDHCDFYDYSQDIFDPGESIYERESPSIITAIAWSPDGNHLASCAWGTDDRNLTVKVLDVIVMDIIFVYNDHTNPVTCVIWSPDGRRIASASSNATHIWDALTGKNAVICNKYSDFLQSSSEEIVSIAWSPHVRHLASMNGYGEIDIWDTVTGEHIFTYYHIEPGEHINEGFIRWSFDGKYLASVDDQGKVSIWLAPY